MTSMREAPHFEASVQVAGGEEPRSDVWLGPSVPEDFLREVVGTLEGFLRASREAPELKTGDSPSES